VGLVITGSKPSEGKHVSQQWEKMLPSGKQPHSYGKITIFNGKIHY
jgi:hypothetical protein